MIPALILGREGSVGFPGKNSHPVFGKPLMYYPMDAAKKSKYITHFYFSTDSESYKKMAHEKNWRVIDRPGYLTTKEALGEDAYLHGYDEIRKEFKNKEEIEMMVLLFCNAATISHEKIDEGIKVLRENVAYDSAVTVSSYNMWSPLRARKIDSGGLLKPFVPFETFGDPKTLNCDRDSQGDVWFADMSVSIVKPLCFENMANGLLPQKWMGQKIYPLKQWGGFDLDYEWQLPLLEYWLKKNKIV